MAPTHVRRDPAPLRRDVASLPAAAGARPAAHAAFPLARAHRTALLVGAVLFLVAHLPLLGTTLADIDAYNFALGVQDYDPALHQPHPPGYPLYIGLAKLSTSTLDAVRPEPAHGLVAGQRNAAQGLAIWSALGGALAVLLLPLVFGSLTPAGAGALGRHAPAILAGATLLTVTCPLFWFTAGRPLSDIPGLAAALLAQAAILAVYVGASHGPVGPWRLAAATFLATLMIGVRSQTMWLTLPLLGVVVAVRWRAVPRAEWWRAAGAGLVGVLVWAVPMIAATGGLAAYMAALGGQGAEDFSGVDMLFRNPTPARLAAGMVHTFVWPWASVPLATLVLTLAALGGGWLLVAAPRVLPIALAAFGPYAVFHLLFHETITTRYALPLVPPIAWLAAAGAAFAARRLTATVLVVVATWGLAVTWPAAVGFHETGSPVSRLIRDLGERASATGKRPAIGMHYEMRRAVGWALRDEALWPHRLACPPGDDVKCVARFLEAGGETPIWFLANPRRADLALIDPRAVREVARYGWPFEAEALTGNPRPSEAAWYEVSEPGWFAGDGWALNPEIAGRTAALGKGPSVEPITARIRRRPGAAVAIVGGRHLGDPTSGPARVDVALDGRPLLSFEVTRDQPSFLRTIELPPGSLLGAGRFAALSIAARGGGPIAVEQFDLQDAGEIVFAFTDGWYEAEHDPRRGLSWRWASDRANLLIHDGGADVDVSVAVEDPGRYFDRAPFVTLSAGGLTLAQARPEGDFTLMARVPAAALRAANGVLTLATDLSYVPALRGESADQRRLGLRVFSVSIGRPRDQRPGSAAAGY